MEQARNEIEESRNEKYAPMDQINSETKAISSKWKIWLDLKANEQASFKMCLNILLAELRPNQ